MGQQKPPHQGGLQPEYRSYKRQKCFIAYSEQATWSEDLLEACQEILSQPAFNLEPDYARQNFNPDVPLRQKVLALIANARYGIYDLSSWQDKQGQWHMPRNIFIELGMAIALNRPTLLLRHANNRELTLPECLQSMSGQILSFSGTYTLKKELAKRLPQWINTPPEQNWLNRYCTFGGKKCHYREVHPRTKQWGQQELYCHISDGPDIDRPDFRGVVEDVLERFSDITFDYLDALPLADGYHFLPCSHCQTVRSSPFAIYRITPNTSAETFIAIGMSIALEQQFEYKIPKILLTENKRDIPSLLEGYEVIVAKSDKERKKLLRQFLPKVMRNARSTAWQPRKFPFIEPLAHNSDQSIDVQEDNLPDKNEDFPFYFEALSKRELLILRFFGLPNSEIAYELGYSEGTIRRRISKILKKLNTRSRAQAIVIAWTFGLVDKTISQNWSGSDKLTSREMELALLIAKGKSNAEMASNLKHSPSTISKHTKSLLEKTKTEKTHQLVYWLLNKELIVVDPNIDLKYDLESFVKQRLDISDFVSITNSNIILDSDLLTHKQREILHLVALGKTNREISEELNVVSGTIASHITHILKKLDVNNRSEAVIKAKKLGLIYISDSNLNHTAMMLGLNNKELEILNLMACGRTNSEISEELSLAYGTVSSYISAMLKKLDINNRYEAVIKAKKLGLIYVSDSNPNYKAMMFRLTHKELEILNLMAYGGTNREISNELNLARSTAGRHVSNIQKKLEVKNRDQAVTKAKELGLI